jgi:hypothetical protein
MRLVHAYSQLLRDPRWQRKRLEALQASDFKCCMCGDGETELHIHHQYYERGKKPWEYELDSLDALCSPCHEATELLKRSIFEKLTHPIYSQGFWVLNDIWGGAQDLNVSALLTKIRDNPELAEALLAQVNGGKTFTRK